MEKQKINIEQVFIRLFALYQDDSRLSLALQKD